METIKFEDFRDTIIEGAEGVGKKFMSPEDDWQPFLFLYDGKQPYVVDLASLLGDEKDKDFLADKIIPSLIEKTNAIFVGLVLSAWTLLLDKDEVKKGDALPLPSKDTRRVEKLVIQVMGRDNEELWHAKIIRLPKQLPTLGKWEKVDSTESSGRFVEPIRKALTDNLVRLGL
jgi:hypothetical protein